MRTRIQDEGDPYQPAFNAHVIINIAQGFFSGIYNALAGRVRRGHSDVGDISGRWDQVMEFKSTKVYFLLSSDKTSDFDYF